MVLPMIPFTRASFPHCSQVGISGDSDGVKKSLLDIAASDESKPDIFSAVREYTSVEFPQGDIYRIQV